MPSYFIEAVGLNRIKIGGLRGNAGDRSWRYGAILRCKELETGCPVPLRVIAVTARYYEDDLHRRFARFRVKGEWFDGAPELWCFIDYLFYRKPRALGVSLEKLRGEGKAA